MATHNFIPVYILGFGGGLIMSMVITDDAHYARSLDWLTERAKKIHYGDLESQNPLMGEEQREAWKAERAKLMVNYDIVADALRMYSQPESMPQPKKSKIDDFL